jgi:hypothetical protein
MNLCMYTRPTMAVLMMLFVAAVCLKTSQVFATIGQNPPNASDADDR